MKFLLAPDSFKESLTAIEVCETMSRAIKDEIPCATIVKVPMADGGEGTVVALITAVDGQLRTMTTVGPRGESVVSYYGIIDTDEGRTAVFEVANIFGLSMVPRSERNPLYTTSAGLGHAIRLALDEGIRMFVIGLGSSSTNDGGLGMLTALGASFYDHTGGMVVGFGKDLLQIANVDLSDIDPRLTESQIIIANDVLNPLTGPQGATYIFGPQKGLESHELPLLDENMQIYAEMIEKKMGVSMQYLPGAGAAGGLGFALMTLGGKIKSGAQVVEEMTGLMEKIQDVDWVLTGEGQSDGQTLLGKLPYYVGKIAKEAGKQVILISGSLGDVSQELHKHFAGCFSTVQRPSTLENCLEHAETNLYNTTRSIARLLNITAGEQ